MSAGDESCARCHCRYKYRPGRPGPAGLCPDCRLMVLAGQAAWPVPHPPSSPRVNLAAAYWRSLQEQLLVAFKDKHDPLISLDTVEGESWECILSVREAYAEATGDNDPLALSFADVSVLGDLPGDVREDAPWLYPEWSRPDAARMIAARRRQIPW